MRESELISVVLPVYNGERFLAESVESVLRQTYRNFELIIVDDCSNDGTKEIIDHYAKIDSRIRVIRNETNQKLPRSLNIGFRAAKGKYYAWTSDDNKYRRDALERLLEELEKHPEYGLIYADMEYINEFDEVIGGLSSDANDIFQYNCVGACFMYRAECRDKLGGYDEKRFLVEDYEYWLRISQYYKIGHIDEALYQYRYHKKSLTIRRTRKIGEQLLKLKKDYFEYLLGKISVEAKRAFIFEMVVYGADKKYMEENAANDFCEDWFFRKREFTESNKIMLFGAGAMGLNALDYIGKENVAAFVDNNPDKIGKRLEGKEVFSFFDLQKIDKNYMIVISTDVRKAYYIARQLEQNDITNYVLFYEMQRRVKTMNANHNYEAYVAEWLKGIDFEIRFWDKLMQTQGSYGGDPEVYKLRISPETRFALEDEIETEEISFCDVGSGPFSNCGVYTDKTNLKITAVDPLAKVYEMLKIKHGVVSPINPVTGMVECLGRQFEENCFDIVHMSNSLDHCFDPVEGIRQMLMICKVGGKIVLRHNENEAEHAKYQGFHQWNIHVENGKFYIWRKSIKIDVAEEIRNFARIEKAEMAEKAEDGSRWVHNKVVIRKTDEIKIENNAYMNVLITKFLEEICTLNMQMTK